jgi:protein-tyrosine phosphatase
VSREPVLSLDDLRDDPEEIDPPDAIVDGRLWQGGSPVDYAWARAAGIDVVVDVSDPGDEPAADDLGGIDYRKCPLVDGDEMPDASQLDELVDHVVAMVRGGRRVLVHCTYGRNRSGLVVALAVRELFGLSGADAANLVRERRRRALNNETFTAHLDGLAAQA